jgi:L-malate glycosyltransferase
MPARPYRILHLIKGLGRGGAEMLLPEGLRHADRTRFEYRYAYFLPWKDALVDALSSQGANVVCYGGRNNLRILLQARRLAGDLRRYGIDLVHCHLPVAGAVGRIAGRIAGVPVVYSEHSKQERYHPLTRRLNRATWRWQSRVVAVSADVADSIRSHIGCGVPVEVVLNGVDLDRFSRSRGNSPDARAKLEIPPGSPVIGTVAVFRVQKRLEDWLEAARLIREEHPSVHFLVVGDGPLRGQVRNLVSEKGLDASVHLVGLQEDVRPFLASMDIYMMSSRFEGLPVALLEAMAMECAPVCTSVGGIPEVVEHGANGYLVAPGDPPGLARIASALLRDPERMHRFGSTARRTVEERFSMARMTRQLEEIYSAVLR